MSFFLELCILDIFDLEQEKSNIILYKGSLFIRSYGYSAYLFAKYVKAYNLNKKCYKNVKQDVGYRIDLLVNNKVIIEVKSIEALAPVHYSQTLTYLKLSGLKLALLINFNSKLLKDNRHRLVNNL